jgi:hypothetical protein
MTETAAIAAALVRAVMTIGVLLRCGKRVRAVLRSRAGKLTAEPVRSARATSGGHQLLDTSRLAA